MEFLQAGHLVEISGTAEEGFPASYVTAMVLDYHIKPHYGANVRFLEVSIALGVTPVCLLSCKLTQQENDDLQFIDEKSGEQLEEFIAAERIRPAPPSAAHFSSLEEIEARLGGTTSALNISERTAQWMPCRTSIANCTALPASSSATLHMIYHACMIFADGFDARA
jgi:hypothetical protein